MLEGRGGEKWEAKSKEHVFPLTYEHSEVMCRCARVCVTWSDDYALSLFNHVDGLIHVDLGVCACDLHGFSRAGGWRAVTSQDHVSQRAIHGLMTGGGEDFLGYPFYYRFSTAKRGYKDNSNIDVCS